MASAAPTPLPYDGIEPDRIQRLGQPHEQIGYFHDHESNQTRYRFNSLGFRSDEFDPSATHQVFAFGDSHTFGVGLDYATCWPVRFVAHWRAERGLEPAAVCLQNLADPGASNAGIARAVVTQCHAVRPDLAVVMFAPFRRTEGMAQAAPFPIGWWTIARSAAERGEGGDRASGGVAEERRARARAYFDFANDEACVLETLRSILLVQYYCHAMKVRLVAACDGIWKLKQVVAGTPALATLWSQVNRRVLCDFDLWSTPGRSTATAAERSRDGAHAGAGQHDVFAQDLLRFANANQR
ncbi:MAG: hypothetical protein U1F60_07545 [Planctomycetota bacterium]